MIKQTIQTQSTQKISLYANAIEKFSIVLMVSAVITLIARWTQDKNPLLKAMGDYWLPYMDRNTYSSSLQYLHNMTFSERLIGFLLDGITMVIIVMGLYSCMQLCVIFVKENIFRSNDSSFAKNQ